MRLGGRGGRRGCSPGPTPGAVLVPVGITTAGSVLSRGSSARFSLCKVWLLLSATAGSRQVEVGGRGRSPHGLGLSVWACMSVQRSPRVHLVGVPASALQPG